LCSRPRPIRLSASLSYRNVSGRPARVLREDVSDCRGDWGRTRLFHRRACGEIESLPAPLLRFRCVWLRPAIQGDPPILETLTRGKHVGIVVLTVAVCARAGLACGLSRRAFPDFRSAPLHARSHTQSAARPSVDERQTDRQTEDTQIECAHPHGFCLLTDATATRWPNRGRHPSRPGPLAPPPPPPPPVRMNH
jgi:hypothetical protein